MIVARCTLRDRNGQPGLTDLTEQSLARVPVLRIEVKDLSTVEVADNRFEDNRRDVHTHWQKPFFGGGPVSHVLAIILGHPPRCSAGVRPDDPRIQLWRC